MYSKKINFICEQANKLLLGQELKIAGLESSAALLKEVQAELKTLHDEKSALLSSNSWKITQPIRGFKDKLSNLSKLL